MRYRARKGEQRAVTAKERQRVGERDKRFLQQVISFIESCPKRARDEPTNPSGVTIEEFVRRVLVARLEPSNQLGLRTVRRLCDRHDRDPPLGIKPPLWMSTHRPQTRAASILTSQVSRIKEAKSVAPRKRNTRSFSSGMNCSS